MHLVNPHYKYEESFRSAFDEMDSSSDREAWVYLGPDYNDFFEIPFSDYVNRLIKYETYPPAHFVCCSTYWTLIDGEIVGRIGLRYELNDFLRTAGGHIGCIVRPTWRGKGIASEMLKQLLSLDRAKSIGKLLLTCDEGNLASEKTLLNNGGKLENTISYDPERTSKKRYWIYTNNNE